jgi:hypothetical protein
MQRYGGAGQGQEEVIQMEQQSAHKGPNRIADLAALKEKGSTVTCDTSFAVVPVDFQHREQPYQAHVFMCYFSGTVDGQEYTFRKCYARGCSHNLCPHVSQAVMIANRYLERDYQLLRNAGIDLTERLFTLEDMLVKFEGYREAHGRAFTIDDCIVAANEGHKVTVEVEPEYVPAVEHFAHYENAQTFLTVTFLVTGLGRTQKVERCLACYGSEKGKEGKTLMAQVANARLEELYKEFDQASIQYEKRFFS